MDSTESSSTENSSAMLLPSLESVYSPGRFAWTVVGSTCVPYIFREDNTKYVANRIVKTEVETQFAEKLKIHAIDWLGVETFPITQAESDLLNHINKHHCELIFGEAAFTESDMVVKLDDLIQYYNFLDLSYNMLLSEGFSGRRPYKCGFVRINEDNDSIIPYVMKNEQKYLPIFYFDGETKSLEAQAIALEKWDLAYLKLCCVAQGIRNDLFAGDKCYVSSLEQIKSYFAEDTKFNDFWPAKAIQSLQSVSLAEDSNHLREPTASAGTAKTQQSRFGVEVGNHLRGPRAPMGAVKTQQSTSRGHFQGPAGTAKMRPSFSRAEVNRNHLRGQAPPAGIAKTAPPPYPSTISNNRQYRWNRPPLPSVNQRTNSSTPTMNLSSNASVNLQNSRLPAASTNSTASFPHSGSLMQPMRHPYTAPRNNFDPRLKKQ